MKTASRIVAAAVAAAALLVPAAARADVHNVAIATKSSMFSSVLDVVNGSTAPGAKVIQYLPTGGANQRWNFVSAGNDTFDVVNAKTGYCLTHPGVIGSQLYVTYCNSANPRRQWSALPQLTKETVLGNGPSGRLGSVIPGSLMYGMFGVPIVTPDKRFAAEVQNGSWQPGAAIVTGDAGPFHYAGNEQAFAYWYWN
jgi:hypothetical protein